MIVFFFLKNKGKSFATFFIDSVNSKRLLSRHDVTQVLGPGSGPLSGLLFSFDEVGPGLMEGLDSLKKEEESCQVN